ncbi:hypothetical protein J2W55_004410 [Mucilaginibacter pocheonensis]|uniref:Uncharacterized protein n=1 Tax=Mucilaginibacter pocheonensis TaxID=398050 RepID=A0ABU1TI89_9SPHI|nr:hypothetical protein [Mucilaginibacter pocheonensis]
MGDFHISDFYFTYYVCKNQIVLLRIFGQLIVN